jgi:hypothetical protein
MQGHDEFNDFDESNHLGKDGMGPMSSDSGLDSDLDSERFLETQWRGLRELVDFLA